MKILNPSQIREVERKTAEKQNISMNELMERAAEAVFEWIKINLNLSQSHFVIICGSGNNGGDGLALARMLTKEKIFVKVLLLKSDAYSEDNIVNQKRLEEAGVPVSTFDSGTDFDFHPKSIIVDALFGYGLNRPIDFRLKSIIEQINKSKNRVVSIDLPSGLYAERPSSEENNIIEADYTLTFQMPKLNLLFAENERFTGELAVLDIELDSASIQNSDSEYLFTDNEFISSISRPRSVFGHKYRYGNVLVIGGSYGKIGAPLLSSRAALRSGAGLVTAYIPSCGYEIFQSSFPEAMVMTDFAKEKIITFPKVEKFDTLAIGPGMGTDEKTEYTFFQFLEETDLRDKKMVIDADGLNLLARNREVWKYLPDNTIFTPHTGELERLIGKWRDSYEMLELTKRLSVDYRLIIVIKGAFTRIFTPSGNIIFNSTGNPGMATAGSGDVLTGVIAGLLGRGYSPADAAVMGVYLHGLAGDLATEEIGKESLIASDIIRLLPQAFRFTL